MATSPFSFTHDRGGVQSSPDAPDFDDSQLPPQNLPEDISINAPADVNLNSAANKMKLMMFSVVLPKGVTVEYAYHGKDVILVYRVRYMHNGQRRTIGMFSNMKDAISAVARARYNDILKELPDNWKDMELRAVEALTIAATEKTIKNAAEMMFKSGNVEHKLKEESFKMLAEMPFHELSPNKSARYVHPITSEVFAIPAKVVAAYFEFLESGGRVE